MIRKVLIPNRGEIAVRIIKTAHKMGIRTVVTLSEIEQDTLPARLSDEVYYFEHDDLARSFLDVDLIIQVAQQYEVDAIHPGYGFLSENEKLAQACFDHQITFIGPTPENLRLMGDKQQARAIARQNQIPLTQSYEGTLEELLSQADAMPYPVLIKAAMGGGGKGMTLCHNKEELIRFLPSVARQALRYFGDDRIYVEQYISSPRHIEVQILADQYGHTVHLFERECSIQRRYQKIIEEAPAPGLSEAKRQELTADAIRLCKAIGYSNAGTIEFLLDENGNHYFLEMNTRIQVEHPITEAITNLDLVEWQFLIASGEQLSLQQKEIKIDGHAIEVRLYAEDPSEDFKPSPGRIKALHLASTSSIRVETGFDQPTTIHPQYDPMIAKFVAHDSSRRNAILNLKSFLENTVISGIQINAPYLLNILYDTDFETNHINTHYCEEHHSHLIEPKNLDPVLAGSALVAIRLYKEKALKSIAGYWRLLPTLSYWFNEHPYSISYEINGNALNILSEDTNFTLSAIHCTPEKITFKKDGELLVFYYLDEAHQVKLIHKAIEHTITPDDYLPPVSIRKKENLNTCNALNSPLPGQVLKVHVKEGQQVRKGDLLLVLEAMKMENHLKAWKDGIIEKIHIEDGHQVKSNQLLLTTN